MSREPVRLFAFAIALAQAIVGVLVAFWADSELIGALGIVMGVLTQVAAEIPRSKVTPTSAP